MAKEDGNGAQRAQNPRKSKFAMTVGLDGTSTVISMVFRLTPEEAIQFANLIAHTAKRAAQSAPIVIPGPGSIIKG